MTAPDYGQGEHALSTAALAVSDARADLDGISRTLEGHVEALRAAWGGQGALAFQGLARAWQDKQHRVVGSLDLFEERLRATEKDNTSTDEAQRAGLAALQHALGPVPGI